jgi:hypothetical protein
MLCLDENIELLKLRSLIDMSNLVPAREYVSRNDERVLILENPEKQYISEFDIQRTVHRYIFL